MDRKQITFSNGNVAWAVIPPKNVGYPEILQALTIQQAKALIIVIGGAKNLDDSRKDTLYPMFSNGLASTAADIGALIIATGLGALLAAIKVELWLPLATALGAAFALYLEYMQVVNTLTKYNQAATSLEDVKQWWTALSESEKKQPESFNKLVDATEKILESEHESWVQNMHNALDKLYKKESTNDRNNKDLKDE